MIFELKEYASQKYESLLEQYLKKIEEQFDYIPFIFSTQFIAILSQFKKLFIILEKKEIVNLFYKNETKNHIGFLFEIPKTKYPFLKSADSVASVFLPKKPTKKNFEEIKEIEELIIDNRKIFDSKEINLKNVNKKVRKIKRDYPQISYEDFKKEEYDKKEIDEFYDTWKNMFEKTKLPYMFLYEKYINFVYTKKNKIEGIIAKNKNKIIGISFFLKSPLKKQAIGLTCNGLYSYKGLNEILAYLRYKRLWKEEIRFVNVGPCGEGEVIENKKKFGAFREKYYIAISKGLQLRKKHFWYNDCLDPDNWKWN